MKIALVLILAATGSVALPRDSRLVFQMLERGANMKVPPEGNHCEKQDGGDDGTIGAFLADYATWSLNHEHRSEEINELKCDHDNCSLTFGYKTLVQPWRRILRFRIKDNAITEKGLECQDIT